MFVHFSKNKFTSRSAISIKKIVELNNFKYQKVLKLKLNLTSFCIVL
jgi:hypothetical protein